MRAQRRPNSCDEQWWLWWLTREVTDSAWAVTLSLRTIPLFPLRAILFPGGPLSLRIFETRYVDMVSRCMREGYGFGVVQLASGQEACTAVQATALVGTEAQVVDFNQLEDGLLGLTCVGKERFAIKRVWREKSGLNMAEVVDIPADSSAAVPLECAHLSEALRRLFPDLDDAYSWITPRWDDASWVGNRIAELAPLEDAVKQGLLELQDPLERLGYLAPLIRVEPASSDA